VIPVRIASKEKATKLTDVRKFAHLALDWLNEHSATDIQMNEMVSFIFINGKRYSADDPCVDITLNRAKSYHLLDMVQGPCWRIEHNSFYRKVNLINDFTKSNWHTDVVFDDEYVALQFKLVSPWLTS
jgi:hypothetical protein